MSAGFLVGDRVRLTRGWPTERRDPGDPIIGDVVTIHSTTWPDGDRREHGLFSLPGSNFEWAVWLDNTEQALYSFVGVVVDSTQEES